ncbi:RNA polymerase sigma factor [Erythrobacter aureus]|uniref:Sigma-70 family RNA polymerase sigma factor n=1 Tax=Erythrobacter aureus TaxID=2182384 RepID=A0A345YBL6_9SPHN|nr:sigma-70 family RNA polymerase sigma factor [Erythrobacter aureus]AXK41318.1 sigma-70 family RNA polymerase sigma factor [Erythrobacter aureus]
MSLSTLDAPQDASDNRTPSRPTCFSEKPPDARQILDTLYRTECDALRAFLSRRAKPEDIDDLIHEVFIRAAKSAQLPHLFNPGGFLCRIAQTVLIDRARRKRARIRTVPLPGCDEPACAPEQTTHIELQELLTAIENALAALPDKTKRIFMMSRSEQRSYREIHQELRISQATVEYHMMKALAHLRAAVELAR